MTPPFDVDPQLLMRTWPLEVVISGGQTGADRAGLRAARTCGYHTGGAMPHNFRAEDRHWPEFAQQYGMFAINNASYLERTQWNVQYSDGTLLFGSLASRGTGQTWRACSQMKKPKLALPFDAREPATALDGDLSDVYVTHVRRWIREWHIRTLNVAGNRESTAPGIEQGVYDFLVLALPHVRLNRAGGTEPIAMPTSEEPR